jgi:hypothetical protein
MQRRILVVLESLLFICTTQVGAEQSQASPPLDAHIDGRPSGDRRKFQPQHFNELLVSSLSRRDEVMRCGVMCAESRSAETVIPSHPTL